MFIVIVFINAAYAIPSEDIKSFTNRQQSSNEYES